VFRESGNRMEDVEREEKTIPFYNISFDPNTC